MKSGHPMIPTATRRETLAIADVLGASYGSLDPRYPVSIQIWAPPGYLFAYRCLPMLGGRSDTECEASLWGMLRERLDIGLIKAHTTHSIGD